MKFLLLFLVLAVAYSLWRHGRQRDQAAQAQKHRPPTAATPPPQEMVACAQCQLHLARTDALMLAGRYYCCAEHRERAQR